MNQFTPHSLLFAIFVLTCKLAMPNFSAEKDMPCDPDFTFTTTPCSQTVSFQAGPPDLLANPNVTFSWDFGVVGTSTDIAAGANVSYTYTSLGGGTATFVVTLTATDAIDGCTSVITQQVTIDQVPHALLTDQGDPFEPFNECTDDTYTLTVKNASTTLTGNASYQITWGDASAPFMSTNFNTTTHTYTGDGSYLITFTLTGANGCASTWTKYFYMGTQPSLCLDAPAISNICSPQTLDFFICEWENHSPGTVYKVYSNADDYAEPLTTLFYPLPNDGLVQVPFYQSSCGFTSSSGYVDAFDIRVVAENPCGTSTITFDPVRVSTPPLAAIETTAPASACPGAEFTFCSNTEAGTYYSISEGECVDFAFLQWVVTGGSYTLTDSTDECIIIVANEPGMYVVCLTASNPCGPSVAYDTVFVSAPVEASANAVAQPNNCAPYTVTFQNTSQNATSNLWELLSGPLGGVSGNLNQPSPTLTFSKNGMYIIRLTASNSCSNDTWLDTIVVTAEPSVSLLPVTAICEGGQTIPSASFTANGCPITTYEWSFPGGNPSSFTGQDPPPVVYNQAGNYAVSVTATNCCGSTTASQTVIVSGIPIADANAVLSNPESCVPLMVTIQNQSQNNPNNSWTVTPSTGWSGNLNVSNPVITINTPGSYNVKLTVSAGICGTDIWDTTIVVRAKPSVSLTTEDIICVGGVINPSAVVNDNGCTVTIHEWAFPGGTPSTFNGPNPPSITYDTPGPHTFNYTATNCCGSTTESQTIMVEDFVAVSVAETLELCVGDPCAPLNGFPLGCNWSQNGTPVTNNQFCPTTIGTYYLVYTCGSTDCPSTDTLTVIVHDLPQITSMPQPPPLCVNDSPVLLEAFPNNDFTWWTGNGIDSSGWFDPSLPGAGGIMTYHHLNPATGCIQTATVSVTVNTLIELNLPAETFCNASQIVLEDLYGVVEGPNEDCIWSGTYVTNTTIGTFILPVGTALPATFTIFYTYTTAADCSVIDSVEITIVPLEQAYAGEDTTLCGEGTYQLVGNLGPLTWTQTVPAIGPPITPDGVINLELAPTGVNTFSYNYTAFGGTTCETSDQASITIVKLSDTNAGGDQHYCITDGLVTLPQPTLPSGNIGIWSGQGVVDSLQGIVDVTLIGVGGCGPITYTVVSNTLDDCMVSDEIVVCVHGLPEVEFSISGETCVDSSLIFENLSAGATKFCWDFGDNSPIVCQFEPPAHPYSDGGDYVVTLTAWSVNPANPTDTLCIDFKKDTIHITEPPQLIAFTASPIDSCADLTLSLINESTGEGLQFKWYKDGVFFSTEFSPPSIVLTQGQSDTTYTITLKVSNDCGGGEVSQTILVRPRPVSGLSSNLSSYCSGDTIYLSNNSSGIPDEYYWYRNGQLISTDSIPPVFQWFTDTLITLEICLVTINECGENTSCLYFPVSPTDVEAIFHTDTMEACVGQPICFKNLSSSWADVYYDFGDLSGSTEPNPCHVFTNPGDYLVVMKAFGCGYDSFTVMVKIHPLPIPGFSYDGIPCPGNLFQFTNSSVNGLAYLWKFGNGDSSTQYSPIHVFDEAGEYTVCLTVTSENSCRDSLCQTVNIESAPIAEINSIDSLCVGDTVEFTSQFPSGLTSCVWTFSDGFFADGCTISRAFTESGDFILILEVENSFGCRDTTSKLVHVRPTPTASFEYVILEPCAPGAKVVFTNTSIDETGVRWYINGQLVQQAAEFEHEFSTGEDHLVTLVASNGGICEHEYGQVIQLQERPQLMFDIEYPCDAKVTDLLVHVEVPGSFDAEVSSVAYFKEGLLHKGLEDGAYQIYVTADNGCFADTSLTLVSPPELSIELLPDSSQIIMGESVHLSLETNLGGEIISWTPVGWLDDTSSFYPTATPYRTVTYFATVTSQRGCTKTDTAHIEVIFELDSSIYVPNVFTPNGDGHNDVFRVRSRYPAVSQVELFQVFGRNGSLVFEARDYDPKPLPPEAEWDGTFQDELLPPGNFVWLAKVAFVDGSDHVFHGEVYLAR